MAPPAYGDLGKQARDVFDKGYHFGLQKLDIKTKTASGVEFSNQLNFNQESGKVIGILLWQSRQFYLRILSRSSIT